MLTGSDEKRLLETIVVVMLFWGAVDTTEAASKATEPDVAGGSLMKDPG